MRFMNSADAYAKLVAELKRLDRLASIGGLLGWDEQVNLPEGSAGLRAEQTATFAALFHRERSSPVIGEWLDSVESDLSNFDEGQRRVIEEARRAYNEATKLPDSFVKRSAEAESRAYHAWKKAREEDAFHIFLPHLEAQIELKREHAAYLGREADAYDYWIDSFDRGMDQAQIEKLFGPLRQELVPLVRKIQNSPVKPRTDFLKGFPEADQERFLHEVLEKMGFDFSRGRMDRAVHPFCGGHPLDVRLTTRYFVDNPLDSLSSAIHEAGHGLYEQGLPEEHHGTALGLAAGMAAHESQSRLWENQVGRSRAFWNYWEPRYREVFSSQLANVTSDALFLAINKVEITPIRVDSDEVTYNLHIMLRFELEKQFFNGELSPKDLPDAWNGLSEDILGFRPKNNKQGCLQDVHWASGLFGYFPSYSLGNMLAAQLWKKLRKENPGIEGQIERGELRPLLDWLRQNVHTHGMRWRTNELAKRVTGSELSHLPLVDYLKERYLPLYKAA